MKLKFQIQYDKIYAYFKNTTEPFDDLNWNGNILIVYNENQAIEEYTYSDLTKMISNFQ